MQKPEQRGAKIDKRHRAFNDTCQDDEKKEEATQEFDMVR